MFDRLLAFRQSALYRRKHPLRLICR
jgi:hypothetical protein